MSPENPFEAPSNEFEPAAEQHPRDEFGGVRRGPYFAIVFVVSLIAEGLENTPGPTSTVSAPSIVSGLVVLVLTMMRIQNMGYGKFWRMAVLIPVLNIPLAVGAMACPEGFAYHRKLDVPGWLILAAVIGMFSLVAYLGDPSGW